MTNRRQNLNIWTRIIFNMYYELLNNQTICYRVHIQIMLLVKRSISSVKQSLVSYSLVCLPYGLKTYQEKSRGLERCQL